jgi:uncharacterized membrane protein YbaN (DUF454 family)
MRKKDYGAEVTEHRSPVVRALLLVAGTICVVLGIIGLFLPVMPTTVFLILAAACYARASRRFYNMLLNSPMFGPAIREWRRHGSIPMRTKVFAIAVTVLSFAVSIVFLVGDPRVRAGMAVFGVVMVLLLLRIPTRRRQRA